MYELEKAFDIITSAGACRRLLTRHRTDEETEAESLSLVLRHKAQREKPVFEIGRGSFCEETEVRRNWVQSRYKSRETCHFCLNNCHVFERDTVFTRLPHCAVTWTSSSLEHFKFCNSADKTAYLTCCNSSYSLRRSPCDLLHRTVNIWPHGGPLFALKLQFDSTTESIDFLLTPGWHLEFFFTLKIQLVLWTISKGYFFVWLLRSNGESI